MRIIDRYVFWTFIKNYLISFMVLVGMYMVLDMVFNFDELVGVKTDPSAGSAGSAFAVLRNVGEYYFYQSFLFFNQLSGIIPVVAAAFTLMRLSRFNELTALLAAGVPLLRVAAPIILAAVVLNGLLLVNQELVVPRIAHKLNRDRNDSPGGTAGAMMGVNEEPVWALQDADNSLLYAAAYAPPAGQSPAVMRDVTIIERDAKGEASAMITARSGRYDPDQQGWVLTRARRVVGLRFDEDPTHPQPVAFWPTSINPEEIELFRNVEYVEMLSTARINQLLARPKSYGTNDLLRVKHWRFTQPIMNVILLLLAIPCVLTREPGKLKAAATKCLLFTGIGMGAVFLAHTIAGHPPDLRLAAQWPAIMAWVPIFLLGPLSVFLLDRVKT